MGVNTDAILCYGFQVRNEDGEIAEGYPYWLNSSENDDESPGDSDFYDFESFVLYHYAPKLTREDPEYYTKIRKIFEDVGVTLVCHCSSEYPMCIVAAKDSEITAYRGNPKELGSVITSEFAWFRILVDFCIKTGIHFYEPCWILASDWG